MHKLAWASGKARLMTQLSEKLALRKARELSVKIAAAPERRTGETGKRPGAIADLLRDALRGAKTYVRSYLAGRGAE
jgi:hypothetical protein